jgi:glycosyltransferase involved in cell wall biosynthesis
MKKAIFIGPAYPYRGGIAAFNENLASIFQSNDWTCNIITFTQQYPNFLFPGKTQLTTDDAPPNLTITRAIYSTNPLNWLKISKKIVAEKPDIVITQYWMPFMAPAFGTILRGIKKGLPNTKCITIVHNFKPHESRIGDQQLNKFLVKRTDNLVCLSESVSEEVRQSTEEKSVHTLFHPIYDHYGEKIDQQKAILELGLDPAYKYILFFGLIRQYKGLDLLIAALNDIKDKDNVKLIIAGEFYQDEKLYDDIITKYDLEDKIIKINKYIPNDDVPKYFCASDLIVLPYKTATQSGVVPIALHFNKNIVVTNVGSLSPLITKHNIGYIAEANPSSIAEQINKYFDDPSLLSNDFSEIKRELSWQSFFDTFTRELSL